MYTQIEKQKQSRAIANSVTQEKKHGTQKFGFIDKRSTFSIQKKSQSSMYSPFRSHPTTLPIQFVKGLNLGNSQKLAKKRFNLSPKKYTFKQWKRGREAQHLIPAAVCAQYNIPEPMVNSAINGMMLPSGRTATNNLRIKSLDKGKRTHIKQGGAHPHYNDFVLKLTKKRGWKNGKVTKPMFLSLTKRLRKANRPKRTGPTKGYVNDIK